MENASWRIAFTELCEEVFRELGFDSPPMLHDNNLPLAMEIHVDSRDFELIHSSTDRPHQILILCKLDQVDEELSRDDYAGMLLGNLNNIRLAQPYFGITADEQELVWVSSDVLSGMRASHLLEKLREIAQSATTWRTAIQDNKHADDLTTDVQGVMLA